jgi:hypothetical protein
MLRRNTRLRREYLYRKSLEGKERTLYEKKRKIRQALAEGKPIPTELRNEEAALRQEIDLEDDQTQGRPPFFSFTRSHSDNFHDPPWLPGATKLRGFSLKYLKKLSTAVFLQS